MKNTGNQALRTLTTWEAYRETGIVASTIVAWIGKGILAASKVGKGKRDIYTFTMLDLQLLLHKEAAGKHRRSPCVIPVEEVVIDPNYQLRAETKLSVVQNYARVLHDGNQLPPLLAIRLGDDKRVTLVDGHHRLHASWLEPVKDRPC